MEDEEPAHLPGMPIFMEPIDFWAPTRYISPLSDMQKSKMQKRQASRELIQTQLFISDTQPCAELIEPITKNEIECINKPHGGIWTSTYNKKTHSSGWTEWCEDIFSDPHDQQWWLLTPNKDARIYTIDTLDDLKFLNRAYSSLNRTYIHIVIGFERIAKDYDAIHVTEEGQWATRHSFPDNLQWDCESTLWFRWCFSEVKAIAQKEERYGL